MGKLLISFLEEEVCEEMFLKSFSDLTGKAPHNVMGWNHGNIKTSQRNVFVMILKHCRVWWDINSQSTNLQATAYRKGTDLLLLI